MNNLLHALAGLLVFQLVGEVIARALALPVPGPVVGMVLLFIALMVRGRVPKALQEASDGLLSHLSLLFVPAGVGVMLHVPLLSAEWRPIAVAVVISTLLTIIVTALVMQLMLRRTDRDRDDA